MQDIQIGSARGNPGSKTTGRLVAGYWADASPVEIPVIIVSGAKAGPTLWVQACVHGSEVGGTLALLDLVRELDPDEMRGTLVAVPVANVAAFRARARESPIDHLNLNRVFPGNPTGKATEQLAHALLSAVSRCASAFVDLHSAGDMGYVPHYAIYPAADHPVSREAQRLAEAAGTPIIWRCDAAWLRGALFTVLLERGVPGIIVEAGGGEPTAAEIGAFRASVKGVMQALGMLAGAPPRQERHTVLTESRQVYTTRGGIYVPSAAPGALVREGDLLGEVRDLFGEVVEEIRCPLERACVVSTRRRGLAVSAGERTNILVTVAEEGSR